MITDSATLHARMSKHIFLSTRQCSGFDGFNGMVPITTTPSCVHIFFIEYPDRKVQNTRFPSRYTRKEPVKFHLDFWNATAWWYSILRPVESTEIIVVKNNTYSYDLWLMTGLRNNRVPCLPCIMSYVLYTVMCTTYYHVCDRRCTVQCTSQSRNYNYTKTNTEKILTCS